MHIVQLDYYRCHPTGKAYIKMTDPQFVRKMATDLQNAHLSSLPLTARPVSTAQFSNRKRGMKGRQEAAQRVVYDGSGPGAGMQLKGCDVLLTGLPSFVDEQQMTKYLNLRQLVKMNRDGELECSVIHIPP